jgi:hypothetical protein
MKFLTGRMRNDIGLIKNEKVEYKSKGKNCRTLFETSRLRWLGCIKKKAMELLKPL